MKHKKSRTASDVTIQRNSQLDCLEKIGRWHSSREGLSQAFLRKPYAGTKAEIKGDV